MKTVLLAALLAPASFCSAQPAEKKLYIFRTRNSFGAKEAMQLLVNGRTVALPKNTLLTIPVTNDSANIEYLDRRLRKWSRPVSMGAQEENYFTALSSVKATGWPQALVLMQQVDKACFERKRKQIREFNVVSL